MEYVELAGGMRMPLLGLGLYQLHGAACERSVADALEAGYRLFDTARMYGNERELGAALERADMPREELFVTTKLDRPCAGYRKAKDAIERSLENLRLDHVDLLLIHEPYAESPEMFRAMDEARASGKVRALGVSNFNVRQYRDFVRACEVPAVNQIEVHAFYQQKDARRVMEEHGTRVQAWSPFAAGSGGFFENPVLRAVGTARDKTAAQVALRFLVQQGVSIIPKTARRERLEENAAVFDFALDDDEMRRIEALDTGASSFGWYQASDPPLQETRRPSRAIVA